MMQPKQNGDGLGKDNVVGNRSSIQETKINTKEIMQKNSTKVMEFHQIDSETTHRKNDNERKAQENHCRSLEFKSNGLAKNYESAVLRSQSTASMMMELSSLPISSCGASTDTSTEMESYKSQASQISPALPCSPKTLQAHTSRPITSTNNLIKLSNTTKPPVTNQASEDQTNLTVNSIPIIKPTRNIPKSQFSSQDEAKESISTSNQSNLAIIKPANSQSSHPSTTLPQQPQISSLPQIKDVESPSLSSAPTPLKALTYIHLSAKYKDELQYMLVEFRKLEQQLKSGTKNGIEGQGSRARREKLHSFILHVEDTAKQVEAGCQTYKETLSQTEGADMKQRNVEEEENVQRLEEHILANLLPVKVRLVKQLTDQGKRVGSLNSNSSRKPNSAPLQSPAQTHIPRGYPQPQYRGPVAFSGSGPASAAPTKPSTYSIGPPHAATAIETQYGRPLGGNKGSSLTKKLHGQTLGNAEDMESNTDSAMERKNETFSSSASESTPSTAAYSEQGLNGEDGMNFDEAPASPQHKKRKILFAGLAPGSDMKSKMNSVAAAAGTDAASAEMYEKLEQMSKTPLQSEPTSTLTEMKPVHSVQAEPANAQQRNVIGFTSPDSTFHPIIEQQKADVQQPKFSQPTTKQAVVSPLPNPIALPTVKKVCKTLTMKKSSRPVFIPRGPASVAADAVATSMSKPRIKHTTPKTKPPIMPPPAPVLSGATAPLKIIGADTKEKQLDIARKERRKRRLENRRRRRKRRQARLRTITESFRVCTPVISHHRNGSVLHPSSQFAHHPGGNIRNGQSNMHANVHGPKSIGMLSGAYPKIRTIEYKCSHCNEPYVATCEFNPWWALTQEECPKCRKTQIPRIDITAPANAIEYHPALLAHAEDGSGNNSNSNNATSNSNANASLLHNNPTGKSALLHANRPTGINGNIESDNEIHPEDEIGLDDDGESSDESMDGDPLEEDFGKDYNGPKLQGEEAAKLLLLIEHASTCPGRHKSHKHGQICNSIKYMMLHVRDCPGVTTCSGDVCPYPWCRKVKHLLYHLVTCVKQDTCSICRPCNLPKNLESLRNLNKFRRKRNLEQARKKAAERMNSTKRPYVTNKPTILQNAQRQPGSVSSIMPNKHVNSVTVGMNGVSHKQVKPIQGNRGTHFPTRPLVAINKPHAPNTKLIPSKVPSQNIKLMPPPSSKYSKVAFKAKPKKTKNTYQIPKHVMLSASKNVPHHPGANIGSSTKPQFTQISPTTLNHTVQKSTQSKIVPHHPGANIGSSTKPQFTQISPTTLNHTVQKSTQVQTQVQISVPSNTSAKPNLTGVQEKVVRLNAIKNNVSKTTNAPFLINKGNPTSCKIKNTLLAPPNSGGPNLGQKNLLNDEKSVPSVDANVNAVTIGDGSLIKKALCNANVFANKAISTSSQILNIATPSTSKPNQINPSQNSMISKVLPKMSGQQVPPKIENVNRSHKDVADKTDAASPKMIVLPRIGIDDNVAMRENTRISHKVNNNTLPLALTKPPSVLVAKHSNEINKFDPVLRPSEPPSMLTKVKTITTPSVSNDFSSNANEKKIIKSSLPQSLIISSNPTQSQPKTDPTPASINPPKQPEIACTNDTSKERSELQVTC